MNGDSKTRSSWDKLHTIKRGCSLFGREDETPCKRCGTKGIVYHRHGMYSIGLEEVWLCTTCAIVEVL